MQKAKLGLKRFKIFGCRRQKMKGRILKNFCTKSAKKRCAKVMTIVAEDQEEGLGVMKRRHTGEI